VFLLDTSIVAELRRLRPHGAVVAWLRETPDASLHISAVTIGELQAGVELAREQDAAKAADIEAWVERVASTYNVLSLDAAIFRRWAQLMQRSGDGFSEDAMIAATAAIHDLAVVTRNIRDFKPFGVATFNPFL
jgi:predicted nucleic acid-binding protein